MGAGGEATPYYISNFVRQNHLPMESHKML